MAGMTKNTYNLPMSDRHIIVLVVYDGFELLDMSGPASVFNMADRICGGGAYEIALASVSGGGIASSCGVVVSTQKCARMRLSKAHSVFVVGGDGGAVAQAFADQGLLKFMQRASRSALRCGSVCTGAFIAAAAGIMDGRRVTTHWRDADNLVKRFSTVTVDPEKLYICDGNVWSSAGISSGIDMALALVEQDHGRSIMTRTAKRLVVYSHRPGNQTQFSSVLEVQSQVNDRFGGIIAWIMENLSEAIGVTDMARQAGMSERTFYRKFSKAVGTTPSKFLERARLDKAMQLLEAGASVKSIPAQIGFQSESGFRAAFEARFKTAPSHHRLMNGPMPETIASDGVDRHERMPGQD
ncbi:MAG: helix-turn-helix domain-containing protein [Pseudomonadota bacterium]